MKHRETNNAYRLFGMMTSNHDTPNFAGQKYFRAAGEHKQLAMTGFQAGEGNWVTSDGSTRQGTESEFASGLRLPTKSRVRAIH